MGNLCEGLPRDQLTTLLREQNGGPKTLQAFKIKNTNIQIFVGLCYEFPADAIVLPVDTTLEYIGSLANGFKALSDGTPAFQLKDGKKRLGKDPEIGEIILTSGGNIKAKRILNVVRGGANDRDVMEKITKAIFERASDLGFQSIAVPAINDPGLGFPGPTTELIVKTIHQTLYKENFKLSDIFLVIDDLHLADQYVSEFQKLTPGLVTKINSSLLPKLSPTKKERATGSEPGEQGQDTLQTQPPQPRLSEVPNRDETTPVSPSPPRPVVDSPAIPEQKASEKSVKSPIPEASSSPPRREIVATDCPAAGIPKLEAVPVPVEPSPEELEKAIHEAEKKAIEAAEAKAELEKKEASKEVEKASPGKLKPTQEVKTKKEVEAKKEVEVKKEVDTKPVADVKKEEIEAKKEVEVKKEVEPKKESETTKEADAKKDEVISIPDTEKLSNKTPNAPESPNKPKTSEKEVPVASPEKSADVKVIKVDLQQEKPKEVPVVETKEEKVPEVKKEEPKIAIKDPSVENLTPDKDSPKEKKSDDPKEDQGKSQEPPKEVVAAEEETKEASPEKKPKEGDKKEAAAEKKPQEEEIKKEVEKTLAELIDAAENLPKKEEKEEEEKVGDAEAEAEADPEGQPEKKKKKKNKRKGKQ